MKRYSSHTMAFWSSRSFLTLKEDWEESSEGRLPKALRNINPNVVEYKGLTGLSPLGLTQLSMGLSANSSKL